MNNISKAVIKRLPRYYRYLGDLKDQGVDHISSSELSRRMKLTASQIRQDLNNFGGFGMQGYGYNVEYLYDEIGKILDLNKKHKIIIIGAGNIGKAMMNYTDFAKIGFVAIAAFDNNPDIIGSNINDIPIYSIDFLDEFIKNNEVDVAVLSVPKSVAIDLVPRLCDLGIKGFWNFAHVDLNVADNIVVENVHLSDSLMRLSYNLSVN